MESPGVGMGTSPPPAGELRPRLYHIHLHLNDNDENHAVQRQALGEEIALFYCLVWK